jgi:catechol 2,3-dioxygenase-like lactoylglutathione lyase family enzyme
MSFGRPDVPRFIPDSVHKPVDDRCCRDPPLIWLTNRSSPKWLLTLPPFPTSMHNGFMNLYIGQTTIVVRDYDEALAFYVGDLGFTLVEDTPLPAQDKRWVVVAPAVDKSCRLLLARAVGDEQSSRIGNQTGNRVFLFLYTDDFWRDFHTYKAKGIVFVREPKEEGYGTVAVFKDLYGNLWDLIQRRTPMHSI